MPVGTQGAVKTVSSDDLEGLGFELILSNTYHLALRPTGERVERLGGLHRFMSWPRAILTDSGGYQVMSLSNMRKISDSGVEFRSHLDGSAMFISPERSMEIERRLGVDISMAFDECPPYPAGRDEVARAMERTHAWAIRSLGAKGENQAVFGIVQGGVHEDLRKESAETIGAMAFDGIAIGGVSVGEPTDLQYPVVQITAPMLPAEKPRYLMGVGHPADILHAVPCGIDLFDCVLPTRMARHHCLYTMKGRVNVSAAKWEEFNGPVDPESDFAETSRYRPLICATCSRLESVGAAPGNPPQPRVLPRLMREIRKAIEVGEWSALMERYAQA